MRAVTADDILQIPGSQQVICCSPSQGGAHGYPTRDIDFTPMVKLRAPARPLSAPLHRQLQTFFRHPGYDDSNKVLFKLHAPDTDNTPDTDDTGKPSLFAQFAIDTCAMITGDCAGRGWISLLRDGSTRVDPAS